LSTLTNFETQPGAQAGGKEGGEKDGREEREGRVGRGYIILLERGRTLGTLAQHKFPMAVRRGRKDALRKGGCGQSGDCKRRLRTVSGD
jgi:hypothetical protein